MIKSIRFQNFRALRNTTLPLSPFTLLVGPNGSGKSTVFRALQAVGNVISANHPTLDYQAFISAGVDRSQNIVIGLADEHSTYEWCWVNSGMLDTSKSSNSGSQAGEILRQSLQGLRVYSFDASAISNPAQLNPHASLEPDGSNLVLALDRMQSERPDDFQSLLEEFRRWLPEYDFILFENPKPGTKSLALRTAKGRHKLPAKEISQGTLIALGLLTLAYLEHPPLIVCVEEPDRGVHPRLLRDIRDALYRLAYPQELKVARNPVQVIATTHNPYLLDLFREHPEEIVIAEKAGLEAKFSRLSDREDLEEILGDAPLSEVWYSGVLGGVPVGA